MIPFGSFGSSHCTTTVLELTGRARTLCGGLPGAAQTSGSWGQNSTSVQSSYIRHYETSTSTTNDTSNCFTAGNLFICLLFNGASALLRLLVLRTVEVEKRNNTQLHVGNNVVSLSSENIKILKYTSIKVMRYFCRLLLESSRMKCT